MNRFQLLFTALVLAALTVLSFGSQAKAPAVPKTLPCGICQMTVNVQDALVKKNYFDFKGTRYVFCSPYDKTAFSKSPLKYIKKAKGYAIGGKVKKPSSTKPKS